MRKSHLSQGTAAIIVTVWIVVIFVGLFTQDYTALQYMTPVMIGVASYLFGDNLLRKRITTDE
jgi:di/tricarboxylate transporter